MKLPQDFVDLLREFARADVRYLVIGGYAVGAHDRPRTTKDLDLLLDSSPGNIARACDALRAFGAPQSVIEELERATPDEIVWMGVPPLRVDFLKHAQGIDFGEAFARRIRIDVEGTGIDVVGLADLISAKRASGRDQDLVDVKRLERLRGR